MNNQPVSEVTMVFYALRPDTLAAAYVDMMAACLYDLASLAKEILIVAVGEVDAADLIADFR